MSTAMSSSDVVIPENRPVRPAPGTVSSDRAPWKGGRFSPRTRCVLANNPSPLTYLGTNTWILSEPGCRACVVVDPGPLLDDHLSAIKTACEEDGLDVVAVVLTHDHVDHAGGAERFAEAVHAPVLGRRAGTLPDGQLSLGGDAPRLQVLSLPGHSSDSVGLVFAKDGSVITGDFMFRQSSTLICWPDGSLVDYLNSLNYLRKIVQRRCIRVLLTAHGLPIDNPLGIIDRQTAHRHERLTRVRSVIEGGAGTDIDRILEEVYSDVDKRLNPAARINVQAQLAHLLEQGDLRL